MWRSHDSVPLVVEEEKLRERLHSGVFSPGRCHARSHLRALPKGKNGPQLRLLASWKKRTPASFDAIPWEHTHTGGGFSLVLFFEDAALPKAGATK